MRLQRLLVGVLIMIFYVLVFGDTGDPSCYSTSGDDITFDGGCSNSKTVDVYVKAQELKMDLTAPTTYYGKEKVALTVGGCTVDTSFLVSKDNNSVGFFSISGEKVNRGKFDAAGYDFKGPDHYANFCPVKFEELQGGWYKVGVSINPATTISGMKMMLKDSTFPAPPYSWWVGAWPWVLGSGLGVLLFVLSVIGGYCGYRRYENHDQQPGRQLEKQPAGRFGARSTSRFGRSLARVASPDESEDALLMAPSPFASLEPVQVKAKEVIVEKTCKGMETKEEAPNAEVADHLPKDKKQKEKKKVVKKVVKKNVKKNDEMKARPSTTEQKTGIEKTYEPTYQVLDPKRIDFSGRETATYKQRVPKYTQSRKILTRNNTKTDKTTTEVSELDDTQSGSEEQAFKVPITKKVRRKLKKSKARRNGKLPIRLHPKMIKKKADSLQQGADVIVMKRLILMNSSERRYNLYFNYNVQGVGNMTIRLQDRIKNLIEKAEQKPDELKTLTDLLKLVKQLATLCDEVNDFKIGRTRYELPWSFKRICELGHLMGQQYFDGVCADPPTCVEVVILENCYKAAKAEYEKRRANGEYAELMIAEYERRFKGVEHLITLSHMAQEAVLKIKPNFNTHRRVPPNYPAGWPERFCKED